MDIEQKVTDESETASHTNEKAVALARRIHKACTPSDCDKEDPLTLAHEWLGLIAEVERLNKALDQAICVIRMRYDDCFDVDAGDPTMVWGFVWEEGPQVTWHDSECPELASVLKERGE